MAEDEEDQQAPVRRRKPEQAAVPRGFRRCQECKEPLHVASKVCPSCGAKMIPSAKARKRKPDGPASSNAEGSGAGKADKADSSGSEASSADEADSDSDNAAASSSDEEDQNNEEQAQKKERMRESSRAGTYERVVLDRLTSKAKVQPAEGLDLAAFVVKGKRARPMLELRAGSNLWFQATILKESQNEMKVHFPATEDEEEVIEWLRKSSSRIWRGSMATKDWRHLGKGAWQPRAKPKAARGRKGRAARKPGRRPGGARGSLMGETTDTRTGGTGMSVEGSEDSEGQEDVASPRPLVPALGPKQAAGRRSVLDSESESDVDVEGNGESADDQTQDQAGTARQQTHRTAGTSGRQADTAARRQGGSAQQAQPGPLQGLVDWFSCHFSLLQSAGRLGSHPLGTTPECGMVPVKVEVLQSGRVELGQEGGQKAHRQSKLAPPETKAHISKIAGPSKPGLQSPARQIEEGASDADEAGRARHQPARRGKGDHTEPKRDPQQAGYREAQRDAGQPAGGAAKDAANDATKEPGGSPGSDGDDSDSDPARKRQKRQAVGPRELNGILSSPFAWEKKRRQAAASSSSDSASAATAGDNADSDSESDIACINTHRRRKRPIPELCSDSDSERPPAGGEPTPKRQRKMQIGAADRPRRAPLGQPGSAKTGNAGEGTKSSAVKQPQGHGQWSHAAHKADKAPRCDAGHRADKAAGQHRGGNSQAPRTARPAHEKQPNGDVGGPSAVAAASELPHSQHKASASSREPSPPQPCQQPLHAKQHAAADAERPSSKKARSLPAPDACAGSKAMGSGVHHKPAVASLASETGGASVEPPASHKSSKPVPPPPPRPRSAGHHSDCHTSSPQVQPHDVPKHRNGVVHRSHSSSPQPTEAALKAAAQPHVPRPLGLMRPHSHSPQPNSARMSDPAYAKAVAKAARLHEEAARRHSHSPQPGAASQHEHGAAKGAKPRQLHTHHISSRESSHSPLDGSLNGPRTKDGHAHFESLSRASSPKPGHSSRHATGLGSSDKAGGHGTAGSNGGGLQNSGHASGNGKLVDTAKWRARDEARHGSASHRTSQMFKPLANGVATGAAPSKARHKDLDNDAAEAAGWREPGGNRSAAECHSSRASEVVPSRGGSAGGSAKSAAGVHQQHTAPAPSAADIRAASVLIPTDCFE